MNLRFILKYLPKKYYSKSRGNITSTPSKSLLKALDMSFRRQVNCQTVIH
jgi:hypothetical protein